MLIRGQKLLGEIYKKRAHRSHTMENNPNTEWSNLKGYSLILMTSYANEKQERLLRLSQCKL